MIPLFESIRQGASPDLNTFLSVLGADLPLLHQFAQTPQEPDWHGEGDVFVHTQMVLDALYADLRDHPVDPDRRLSLVLAALLHDIAKPLCTKEVDIGGIQRIAAAGHEAKGRNYLLLRGLNWGLPYQQLTTVGALVGEHLLPKLLVKKNKGPEEFRKVSRRVDPLLLTRLERADMRGRWCADQKEQVEAVELFGLYAEEYETLDWVSRWRQVLAPAFAHLPEAAQDWAFGEAILSAEAGKIRTPEEALYLAHAVPKPLPELVVLMGPSGAGKSSWARRLEGYNIVSLDALRQELTEDVADQSMNGQVRQLGRERLKAQLRAGGKVVWDATNLRRDFRQQVIEIGMNYRALVTLVVFQQDAKGYRLGNKNRRHSVPSEILEAQLDRMEWPVPSEAHRWIVLDRTGGVLAMEGRCAEGLPLGLHWADAAPHFR